MALNTSSHTPNFPKITQSVNTSGDLSDEEIAKIVEERLEYLKWLMKYSKANHLKLLPSPAWLNTFACGLDEHDNKIAEKYLKWEIKFHEIPTSAFMPKVFYYDLKMLLKSDLKSLWAISDHELGHAEFTDYSDLFWIHKYAKELKLPLSKVALFFNGANEDPFIGRHVSKKWPARRNMVEHLYKTMQANETIGEKDITHISKLDQLSAKMAYHWLNSDFPNTYNLNLIVDEEIQNIFDSEILPYFNEMISPDISNLKRTILKNSILFPIIEKLIKQDMEERKMQKKLQEMMQNDQNNQDPSDWEESWEQNQPSNNPSSESSQEPENSDEDISQKPWKSWEMSEEQKQKARESLENMTDEEIEALEQDIINEIDDENLEELQREIPRIDWSKNENGELDFKPKSSEWEDKNQSQELEKRVEKAIEKHEQEIEKTKDLEKQIANADDKADLWDIQKEIDDIKSDKLKKALQEKQESKRKQIEEQEQRQLQNMIEQWFHLWEEEYYEEYIKLEAKIEPYVDEFIRNLTSYIPKLKEYMLEGNYYSGTMYDIPRSGRKIRMGHYDIYGRKDEHETMKINLGLSLSLDVSKSMEWSKIEESMKLLVFLWIFCQKLSIPFYVNTIGQTPKEIKKVVDDYVASKWDIMRASWSLEYGTNMIPTFKQVREVQIDQKYHNPEIEFIPIIITDGEPTDHQIADKNSYVIWDDPSQKKVLSKIIDEFEGMEVVFWLSLKESEKQIMTTTFPRGKKIFLDDSTQILTKGMNELIDYLVGNKDRIFKVMD